MNYCLKKLWICEEQEKLYNQMLPDYTDYRYFEDSSKLEDFKYEFDVDRSSVICQKYHNFDNSIIITQE